MLSLTDAIVARSRLFLVVVARAPAFFENLKFPFMENGSVIIDGHEDIIIHSER